jgi:hypothetical protein
MPHVDLEDILDSTINIGRPPRFVSASASAADSAVAAFQIAKEAQAGTLAMR